MAFVVVAVLGGALLLTKRGADRAAEESIGAALEATQSSIQATLDRRWETLQNVTAALARVPDYLSRVDRDLRRPDAALDLLDQAREFRDQSAAAWSLITDEQGILRAWTYLPDLTGDDMSEGSLIGIALEGEKTTGTWIEPGQDGDIVFQAVGVPLVNPDGRIVGVLVTALPVDGDFAADLKRQTGSEIVFFTLDEEAVPGVALSTVASADLDSTLAATITVSMLEEGAGSASLRLPTADDLLVGVVGSLPTAAGFAVGGYAGLRSWERELAAYTRLQQTVLVVFGVGLALALISSLIVARQITRPVSRLVAATNQVKEGQYSGTIDIKSRDEIGELARAFQRMMSELREKQEMVEFLTTSGGTTVALRPDQAATLTLPTGQMQPSQLDLDATGMVSLGTSFAGRYTIKEILGAGGMGVVYRARDEVLGETVAIKTLKPDAMQADATLLERFHQEIRLARRITHRNVVRTHDIGEVQGLYYITMEYVEGTSLKDVIRKRGRLPVRVTLTVGKHLCRALEVAHEEGVIHRDVKPQNLVVDPTGFVKVMDFGIARLAERPQEREEGLTEVGHSIGTPDYMAPEQLLGEEIDRRTDLYAAGAVLYECLTGGFVYDVPTIPALIAKHIEGKPPDPRTVNSEVPEHLARIILKALAKERDKRWQSAAEMHEALDQVQVGTQEVGAA